MGSTRDSYLRCTVCGREETTSFRDSLRDGWPKCCGYTMRLERTDANVGDALVDTLPAALDRWEQGAKDRER